MLAVVAMVFLCRAPASAQCEGDCNLDKTVTVDELITGINIALSARPLSTCKAFDVTRDGVVTIDELVSGVKRALEGCVPVLNVWQPATVPFDPECLSGCQDALVGTALAHGAGELRFQWNPAVDDAVAQWGDCLASMLRCFREQHDIRGCAAAGNCPGECKALFAQRAPAGGAQRELLRVLDGVYVDNDAPCRPPARAEP